MSCNCVRVGVCALLALAPLGVLAQSTQYRGEDPAAALRRKIDSGKVRLEYDSTFGFLPSLLKQLGIDPESQVLVFSKTSFQAPKISPGKPRALFFSDTVMVGSVQDSDLLELAGFGARDGINFYTMDARPAERPEIERQGAVCLSCHAPVNLGLGGLVVSSNYPDRDGMPLYLGFSLAQTIDHRTPLEDRWGGWYVTGTQGTVKHMGNAMAPDPARPADLETKDTQNLTSLAGKFDASNYLQPTSDIVALMTLEHQVTMMNLIARLTAQSSPVDKEEFQKYRQKPYFTDKGRLDALVEETLAYMLFVDETPLKAPVKGTNSFAANFEARGPRDPQRRSLRDFDLRRRMFKYPLTYMVYSEPFDAIPAIARDRLLKRLYEVLTGTDTSPRFAKVSRSDRRNILEILRATKPDLPDYWRVDNRQQE